MTKRRRAPSTPQTASAAAEQRAGDQAVTLGPEKHQTETRSDVEVRTNSANQPEEGEPSPWTGRFRAIVSVLLAAHLFAIVIPPLWVACTGSPLAAGLSPWVKPYTDATALGQGYAFFAPEPPQGSLLRYRATFEDGSTPIVGTLPDVSHRFPRLWFHRHFMLADQLHSDFVLHPQGSLPPEAQSAFEKGRHRYDLKKQAFAAHLKAVYGAETVEISRVTHHVRPWEAHREGMLARDPRLYEVLSDEAIPPGRFLGNGSPNGRPGGVEPEWGDPFSHRQEPGAGILRADGPSMGDELLFGPSGFEPRSFGPDSSRPASFGAGQGRALPHDSGQVTPQNSDKMTPVAPQAGGRP